MKGWIVVLLLTATMLSWCEAGGKKYKLHYVTFHLEAESEDNPKFHVPVKLGSEGRQYSFNKIPTFTDHDIAWFYPFTAPDGVTFGTAFKLKEHARVELRAITLTNQGKLLGIRCGDAPLQAVLIDRPIGDGIIVAWSGIPQAELKKFKKRFPHVDDLAPKENPEFALPNQ